MKETCDNCIFWNRFAELSKQNLGVCKYISEYCINLTDFETRLQGISIIGNGKISVVTDKNYHCKAITLQGGKEILKKYERFNRKTKQIIG